MNVGNISRYIIELKPIVRVSHCGYYNWSGCWRALISINYILTDWASTVKNTEMEMFLVFECVEEVENLTIKCSVTGVSKGEEDAIIEEPTVESDIGASREGSRTGKMNCYDYKVKQVLSENEILRM